MKTIFSIFPKNPAFKHLAFSVVPLLTLVYSFSIISIRNPFYMQGQDPSYIYLGSFIDILSLKKTTFLDNPGLTQQLWGSLISGFTFLLNLDQKVGASTFIVNNAEIVLRTVALGNAILFGLILLTLSRTIFKYTDSVLSAISIQLLVVSFSAFAMYRSVGVATEPFVITTCIVGIITVINYLQDNRTNTSLKWSLIFAATTTLILITKMITLPVMAVFFFALSTWKQRFIYLAVTVLLICSTVLLLAQENAPYFFNFLWDAGTSTGPYGSGDSGIDLIQFGNNVYRITKSDPLILLVAFGGLISIVASPFFSQTSKTTLFSKNVISRVYVGSLITILGQFFVIGKQFRQHYLLPTLLPIALMLLCLWTVASNAKKSHIKNYIVVLVVLSIAAFNAPKSIRVFQGATYLSDESKKVSQEIEKCYSNFLLISYQCTFSKINAFDLTMAYSDADSVEEDVRRLLPSSILIKKKEDFIASLNEDTTQPKLILSDNAHLAQSFPELEKVFSSSAAGYLYRPKSDF